MVIMLSLFLFACDNQHEYERQVSRYEPYITNVQVVELNVPVNDNVYKVKTKFHMSETTVPADMKHVVLASQMLLSKLDERKQAECVSQIDEINIYHVPCKALNDSETNAWMAENYIIKDTSVVVGMTAELPVNQKSKFAVGYCFDEMVKVSTRVSYEDQPYWREVTLAHEIAHVWFQACEPTDTWLDPDKYELKAWEFHESYEETAKKLHVSY
jgi:hypothetical protein|tara:strand:+ start:544 stop:1185 length:642 start_codon:yes stop_codon:yes gene_type:complete